MFKAAGYTITFKRIWHLVRNKEGNECFAREDGAIKSGRYDTLCQIRVTGTSVSYWTGAAKLHPKDKPDKIIGKKIALARALDRKGEFFLKCKRKAIWKAFWAWVASWPDQ